MSIETVIARIEERQRRLMDPAPFFRRHRQEYRESARRIVRSVGRILRPARTDIEEWETFLEVLTAHTISAMVTAGPEGSPGLDVELRLPVDALSQEGNLLVSPTGISFNQVREWVEAGVLGDPLGKLIDDRDRDQDADNIALRVWRVLHHPQGGMSGDSIRDYLLGRIDSPMGKVLSQILAAWREQMLPTIRRDWRKWVREQMALG